MSLAMKDRNVGLRGVLAAPSTESALTSALVDPHVMLGQDRVGDRSADGLVERAFALVQALCTDNETVGVSELARRCGLPKSTTYRILGILEKSGMVRRAPEGYRLGHRIYALVDTLHECQPSRLRDALLPYLVDSYELTRETVHLGVRQGDHGRCVERLGGRKQAPATPPRVGERLPLHRTGLGKVLLTHAPEAVRRRSLSELTAFTESTLTSAAALSMEVRRIRRDGYAVDHEESGPGLTSVAVPVYGASRTVVAALSITGPAARFEPLRVVDALRRIADAASRDLQAHGF